MDKIEFRYYLDYDDIIASFKYNVLLQIYKGSFQGNTFVLFENENRYGYVVIGWGCCSDCDALAACSNQEDLNELQEQIHREIKWFNTLECFLTYFYITDFETEQWYYDGGKSFIKNAKNRLIGIYAKSIDKTQEEIKVFIDKLKIKEEIKVFIDNLKIKEQKAKEKILIEKELLRLKIRIRELQNEGITFEGIKTKY